jgi:hypothetical protein
MGSCTGMDQETEALLVELRGASQTDLARLIERLARHRGRAMGVGHAAVAAWERRAPEAWHMVSAWLARREIPIIVIAPASDAGQRLSSAH